MIIWSLIVAILSLGLAQFLFKLTVGIHPAIAALLNAIAFLIIVLPINIAIWMKQEFVIAPRSAAAYAFLTGLLGAIYVLTLLRVYSRIPVSVGSPAILFGGASMAALLGMIFLGEQFSWRIILGLILLASGYWFLISK